MNYEQILQAAKDEVAKEMYGHEYDRLADLPQKKILSEAALRAMREVAQVESAEFAEWIERNMWTLSNDKRFEQTYGRWYNKPNPNIPREQSLTIQQLYEKFKTTQP